MFFFLLKRVLISQAAIQELRKLFGVICSDSQYRCYS